MRAATSQQLQWPVTSDQSSVTSHHRPVTSLKKHCQLQVTGIEMPSSSSNNSRGSGKERVSKRWESEERFSRHTTRQTLAIIAIAFGPCSRERKKKKNVSSWVIKRVTGPRESERTRGQRWWKKKESKQSDYRSTQSEVTHAMDKWSEHRTQSNVWNARWLNDRLVILARETYRLDCGCVTYRESKEKAKRRRKVKERAKKYRESR